MNEYTLHHRGLERLLLGGGLGACGIPVLGAELAFRRAWSLPVRHLANTLWYAAGALLGFVLLWLANFAR